MKFLTRVLILIMLLALGVGSIAAQEATEPAQSDVTFAPFADELFRIEGIVPQGWPEVSPGLFSRSSGVGDETWIVVQSALTSLEAAEQAMMQQLRLPQPLVRGGEYESQAFVWTLYSPPPATAQFDRVVQLGLAHDGGRTYVVMMQSTAAEAEPLREAVLMPVLDALRPLVDAAPEAGTVPYTEAEVTFQNGDITLAGTLTLPEGDGPHPAILLVTGSGPQDRDSSLAPVSTMRPFRLIADELARAGIAVLRYDDRGVGRSTGVFDEATMSDFTADAAAGIDFLLGHDEIDAGQVGILGHSEGGMVASGLAAHVDSELAFIVLLAAPGVSGRDVLFLQNEKLLRQSGATDDQINAQRNFLDEAIELVNAEDWETLESILRTTITMQYDALPDSQRAALGNIQGQIDATTTAQMQSFRSGWFGSFVNYDPQPDWAQVTVPVLAFYGGLDIQVDAEQNAPALEAALAEAGNEDVTILRYTDANHLFQAARTGSVQEYEVLQPAFVPEMLPDLRRWLLERVTVGG